MMTDKPRKRAALSSEDDQYVKGWLRALGAQLALEREKTRLNQTEWAAKIGVHQRTVSDLERGLNGNIVNYLLYCKQIGMSPTVLFLKSELDLSAEGDPDAGLVSSMLSSLHP